MPMTRDGNPSHYLDYAPPTTTPAEQAAARQVIAGSAIDADDLRLLLDALGLRGPQ